MQKEVVAKVFRWDPSVDRTSRYKEYHIPWREKLTVLDVLRYIYEKLDPISFEYGCRSMMCGRCGVRVNGEPVLSCETFVNPGEVKIEPLEGFPVIKDLVVDRNKVEQRVLNLMPQLIRTNFPESEPEVLPIEAVERCMDVLQCRSCYLCHSACPVVTLAWDRFCGPAIRTRNQALRVYDPRDEADRIREVVNEGLWLCTTCLKCEEVCPMEIDIPTLTIKDLRERATAQGLPIPSGYKKVADRAFNTGRILKAKEQPLLSMVPETVKVSNPVKRVGFFVGCVFDHNLQNSGKAALDVLRRNKVEVILPKDQVCCGMPMFWTGQSKLVGEYLLKRNVEAFERVDVDTVLTMCPSCGMTWKEDIPKLSEEILGRKPDFEVLDIHRFLTKEIDLNIEDMEVIASKITYHDPCHLRRGMKISEEPRLLIQQVPGTELIEMEKSDLCCGGFLRFSEPALADELASKKIPFIKNTGATIVATACPLCTDQLSIAIRRGRLENVKVLNVMDLLNMSYKKM